MATLSQFQKDLINMPWKDPEKRKEYQKRYRERNREKRNKHSKKYHKENPEVSQKASKKYYWNNSEKCRKESKERYNKNIDVLRKKSREWHRKNPERSKKNSERWRKNNPKYKRFGLSLSEYTELKDKGCGICRCKDKKLFFDHDHKTGGFRGLLCPKCNTSIGGLGDDIDGLMRAVEYLKVSKKSQIEIVWAS